MNSIPILIIGIPAVLAAVSFKLHERGRRLEIQPDESERFIPAENWSWPSRGWSRSRAGEK